MRDLNSFKCPNCGVHAVQIWTTGGSLDAQFHYAIKHAYLDRREGMRDYEQTTIKNFLDTYQRADLWIAREKLPRNFAIATCESCSESSVWIEENQVYPRSSAVDPPSCDLSDELKSLYDEAKAILVDSPKGAAAILRLAIQKLMIELGQKGKEINKDIGALVATGLPPKVQKALDLVRVVGNNAVHPGQISLDDDRELAETIFKLVNLIAYECITRPREIEDLYKNTVTTTQKEAIERRDGK